VLYLLLALILGTVVIGPDDDPDFLWRLTHGDNNPR
jgi:hypothetical protein